MIGLDWIAFGTGMGVIIASIFSGLAALGVGKVRREVQSPNGDPRSAGEVQAAIAKAVGVPDPSESTEPAPTP